MILIKGLSDFLRSAHGSLNRDQEGRLPWYLIRSGTLFGLVDFFLDHKDCF